MQSWGSLALTLQPHFSNKVLHSHAGRTWGPPEGLCPRPPLYLRGLLVGTPFWLLSNYSQEPPHFPLGLAQVSFSGNQLLLKCHRPSPNYKIPSLLWRGQAHSLSCPCVTLHAHTFDIHNNWSVLTVHSDF